jgi:uncharacterized membrane protein
LKSPSPFQYRGGGLQVDMGDLVTLAVGTVLLRPYVFVFLAAFLAAGARDLGGRRTLLFALWGWAVAFLAELSSTRNGFPFGLYHYTEATRGQELYLANVPFMDSLSFAFLAYAALCLARLALGRGRGPAVVLLAGLLMMLLDVVIDPLAVRGDRWFLGRIFFYPEGGIYWGVPLSNFAGWALVGWTIVGGAALGGLLPEGRGRPVPGALLYGGVLAFGLAVTLWIGETALLAVGLLLHAAVAVALLGVRRRVARSGSRTTARDWWAALRSPEPSGAAGAGGGTTPVSGRRP